MFYFILQLIYKFNCGSGNSHLETGITVNDGNWHRVVFARMNGNEGKLVLDNVEVHVDEINRYAKGNTKMLEVSPDIYLGGLPRDLKQNDKIRRELGFRSKDSLPGFIGCLKSFRVKGKAPGKWVKHKDVIACSDKVERGYFFGSNGGRIKAINKIRVGLDFDVTMWIKPRNISGIILAVRGRRDYLILQMVDGSLIFNVDNGRGPITASFEPESKFQFCNGQWHEIHGTSFNC